jgi:hypothetical protein
MVMSDDVSEPFGYVRLFSRPRWQTPLTVLTQALNEVTQVYSLSLYTTGS